MYMLAEREKREKERERGECAGDRRAYWTVAVLMKRQLELE